ncbi:MAG: hypothetical protein J6Y37_06430 [Paludibacteraceae bacterium]|nr:hypothetical protein [Paludibacteraceae bacterium]
MDDIEYNENEAIDFIMKRMPKELKASVKRDDVDYLLEVIYDFYEEQGFLSEGDENAEVEINEQDMVNYLTDRVAADGRSEEISENLIDEVLDGEYEYCKSKGIY